MPNDAIDDEIITLLLGSSFNDLSIYDRVVKAKVAFPHFKHKILAEDIVRCNLPKFRKHLAKAEKQGHLKEDIDEQAPFVEPALPSGTSKPHTPEVKCPNNGSSSNSVRFINQYKIDKNSCTIADEANGLCIGDSIIVCDDVGGKSHGIAEGFDVRNKVWRVRLQSNFQMSLVSMRDIQVFEINKRENMPIIISESANGLVMAVERPLSNKKNGKSDKLTYEVINRPLGINSLPFLYPVKPPWTAKDGFTLISMLPTLIPVPRCFFNGLMQQRELDAKMSDFYYLRKVFQCNVLKEKQNETRLSLREWNQILEKAQFHQIKISTPLTKESRLNFKEFMEMINYPSIDDSQRNELTTGLSFDFVPQLCEFCGTCATSLPVCECGESYCNPACRLADWDMHERLCGMARESMIMINLIDTYWLQCHGYKSDCEGRPFFS